MGRFHPVKDRLIGYTLRECVSCCPFLLRRRSYRSPTDRRLAFYPGALYLIATLMDAQGPHIRAWAIGGERSGGQA